MTAPSLRTRIRVHRAIESLKAAGMPFDALDIADDNLGSLGLVDPSDQQEVELFTQEVQRLLTDPEWISGPCSDNLDSSVGISDPFGELTGGRVPVTQLLFRRSQPEERSRSGVT